MASQREKSRIRKTLNFPEPLNSHLQKIADQKYGGDFSMAVILDLGEKNLSAKDFKALREFMDAQAKFKKKKK